MKIKSKNLKTKLILISSLVVVLLTAAVIGMYAFLKEQQKRNNFNDPQIDNTVTDTSQPLVNDSSNAAPTSEGKALLPAAPLSDSSDADTQDPPEKPKITRSEQTQNGSIRVSVIYTQPSDGVCKLVLSKGSQVIEKSAPVIVGPSYYTCNGFLIPRSEIPESGEWTVTITHLTKNKESASASTSIQIQ